MKIKFQSKYLGVLAQSAAKKDARYYLESFKIYPAPEKLGGVFLASTNGHILTLIHDKDGETDGEYLIKFPWQIVTKCKEKRGERRFIRIQTREGLGDLLELLAETIILKKGGVLSSKENVISETLWAFPIKLIDGAFPNLARVLPAFETFRGFKGIGVLTLNPSFLELISKALSFLGHAQREQTIRVFGNDPNSSLFVLPETPFKEVVFIVMPKRVIEDKNETLPWYHDFFQMELNNSLLEQKRKEAQALMFSIYKVWELLIVPRGTIGGKE